MASNPTLLVQPIAENGTKNAIPATTTTPGAMSQDQGFPLETSLPLGAGGVAPDRADFNGAFNLLGGVAYYAQKGWRFEWDAGQEYFEGCIVIDTTDGNAYQSLADVAAGGSVPSADSTNWRLYAKQLTREIAPFTPGFNKRQIFTSSTTFSAPVTGWYRWTIKGGGGGGGGAGKSTSFAASAAGGGEGGTTIRYHYITAGTSCSVIVGAGGNGGAASTNSNQVGGTAGGNSSVTVGGNTWYGYGGSGATGNGGLGGNGDIPGAQGGQFLHQVNTGYGAPGGGNGGGSGGDKDTAGSNGTNGGGGGGGGASNTPTNQAGGKGGDGYVWVEYFDPTMVP